MFHHVGFSEGDNRTRLERDDVDVHVVAHVAHVDEARGHPFAIGTRHGDRLDIVLVGHEGLGVGQAFDGLIALANPVETYRRRPGVAHAPFRRRRYERIAAGTHVIEGSLDRQRELSVHDEQHALGVRVMLRPVTAAAGAKLHDVLGKGFGEAGKRTGQHPHAHVVPEGQMAGDDVAQHALGNDCIGFGEHCTIGQQLSLLGMSALGDVVRCACHGSPGAWRACRYSTASRVDGKPTVYKEDVNGQRLYTIFSAPDAHE